MRWTDFGCSASAEAGPWWSTAIGRPLQRIEILLPNEIFIALNIRNRVGTILNRAAVVSLLIRIMYVYSAISLVIGIGAGFYVLGLVLVVTLARTMASCWALLTALA